MLRIVLFFFIIILATPISGQQILISEDLRGDTMVPKFGMNRKNFGHFYSGFHGFAGSAESLADSLNYTTSWAFDCGYRYKRRFSQVLSAGIEWQIKRLSYSTRQWDKLHTSAATKVDKQKLVFLQTGLSFYQRFNYDKRRGDYVGRYFDVGVYGDWSFNIRHEYFYRNRAGAKVRIRESGLDFIQPFEWGVLVRLGFNNVVLKTSYRFSDHFKETSGIGEFPRLTYGLEIGIFAF